jgi:hypothetical protein
MKERLEVEALAECCGFNPKAATAIVIERY